MKLVLWIVGLPLLLVAAFFAVANREMVTVSLWPFADPVQVPLFAAIVVPLYAGVVIGGIAAWWSGRRARRRPRREARRADGLDRDNAALKARLEVIEATAAARRQSERQLSEAPPKDTAPPAPLLH